MKRRSLTVLALGLPGLLWQRGPVFAAADKPTAQPWTFTTKPYAAYTVVPTADASVLPLWVSSSDKTTSQLSKLSFVMLGDSTLAPVSNARLVYFARKGPGVVVATNGGAPWASNSTLDLVLSSPITVKSGFTGYFELHVDTGANANHPYAFRVRLQNASVLVNGVEKPLSPLLTGSLPLDGDSYGVQPPATNFTWSFGAPVRATHDIRPGVGVSAQHFGVSSTDPVPSEITRMDFVLTGTNGVQGAITNVELVYFQNGVPTVVASSAAAQLFGPLQLVLSSPVRVQPGFFGEFALRVNVGGTPVYSFQERLQTVTIRVNGVEKLVDAWMTCDLPLDGDSFNVQPASAFSWSFTAPARTTHNIAPATGVIAHRFTTLSTDATASEITRMDFVLTGTNGVQGSITNARLVHFLNGAPTVVATSSGVQPFSPLQFVLGSALPVQPGLVDEFALEVDVGGTSAYSFQETLQTVTIRVNGVEKFVDAWMTCDLPLQGDGFNVN